MRILVTGGCGFVGFNLCRWFKERGHEVVALDNMRRPGSGVSRNLLKDGGVSVVVGDVTVPVSCPWFDPGGLDVILHCAAQPSAVAGDADPDEDFRTNVTGTYRMLELARRTGAGLIFWSTNKVYPDSLNHVPFLESGRRFQWYGDMGVGETRSIDGSNRSVYGACKAAADILCQEWASAFGVKVWVNRCSCLYGPWQWGKAEQGWVSWFLTAALLGKPVQLIGWGGKQLRDVLYIDDLCRLVEKQVHKIGFANGSVFNVGGGPANTLSPLELVDHAGLRAGGRLEWNLLPEPRRADHRVYVSDIRKVSYRFGWTPEVGVPDGLGKTWKWIKDNRAVLEELHK